jgi:hypothetical protein
MSEGEQSGVMACRCESKSKVGGVFLCLAMHGDKAVAHMGWRSLVTTGAGTTPRDGRGHWRDWLQGHPVERFWVAGLWAGPVIRSFSNIQKPSKLENSNTLPSQGPKIFKLCMRLYWNVINNFLHCKNIKFPLDFVL